MILNIFDVEIPQKYLTITVTKFTEIHLVPSVYVPEK